MERFEHYLYGALVGTTKKGSQGEKQLRLRILMCCANVD